MKIKTLSMIVTLALPLGAFAQGNLIQNGSFASGGTDWNNNFSGAYFYNESTVGVNIASLGWVNGQSLWQNTGADIQAGQAYQLSVTAQVGQAPATGVTLTLQDPSQGWTTLAGQTYTFTSQSSGPSDWETFTLNIPASTITAAGGQAGDNMGVGLALVESPSNQYGWIWVESMSLTAVPEPSSLALLGAGIAGAMTIVRRRSV